MFFLKQELTRTNISSHEVTISFSELFMSSMILNAHVAINNLSLKKIHEATNK